MKVTTMKRIAIYLILSSLTLCSAVLAAPGDWRAANEKELKTLIPARAPVEKEQIETEIRTASGVTDGQGHFIAGVSLNTAGYAAAGKYSIFVMVQQGIEIGGLKLMPGNYVLGWQKKGDDALEVKFYDAHSGQVLGTAEATRLNRTGRIDSFRIFPPGGQANFAIAALA